LVCVADELSVPPCEDAHHWVVLDPASGAAIGCVGRKRPLNPGVADLVLSPCARRLLSPEMGRKGETTQRRIELRVPKHGRPKARAESDLRRKSPRPLLWVGRSKQSLYHVR